ncbi:MAG: hypothetical protein EBT83_17735, partial [Betaproteobacteria bacterium]|nr:hypothetical protein [Betaproteobacteria bacterium]
MNAFEQSIPSAQGGVGDSPVHESAHLHVSGSATYIDDIADPALGARYGGLKGIHADTSFQRYSDSTGCAPSAA